MLVDTHAHVNFRSFKDDAEEVIQRSLSEGTWVVNVGSQKDTSRQAVDTAGLFPEGVFAAVGLHPEHTHSQHVDEEEVHFKTREEIFDYGYYRELAVHEKVVAIGECGLDYYRLPEDGDIPGIKQKQKDAFVAQIRLAKELNKALIIHSRSSNGTDDAVSDLLEILRDEGVQNLRFVFHSYTGSPELAERFYELGGYIGFNGIITFDKTGNMRQLVERAPLERIVVETDCPWLTPAPNRGKRNEPSYVKFVAAKVAEIRGLAADEMGKISVQNSKALYNI